MSKKLVLVAVSITFDHDLTRLKFLLLPSTRWWWSLVNLSVMRHLQMTPYSSIGSIQKWEKRQQHIRVLCRLTATLQMVRNQIQVPHVTMALNMCMAICKYCQQRYETQLQVFYVFMVTL